MPLKILENVSGEQINVKPIKSKKNKTNNIRFESKIPKGASTISFPTNPVKSKPLKSKLQKSKPLKSKLPKKPNLGLLPPEDFNKKTEKNTTPKKSAHKKAHTKIEKKTSAEKSIKKQPPKKKKKKKKTTGEQLFKVKKPQENLVEESTPAAYDESIDDEFDGIADATKKKSKAELEEHALLGNDSHKNNVNNFQKLLGEDDDSGQNNHAFGFDEDASGSESESEYEDESSDEYESGSEVEYEENHTDVQFVPQVKRPAPVVMTKNQLVWKKTILRGKIKRLATRLGIQVDVPNSASLEELQEIYYTHAYERESSRSVKMYQRLLVFMCMLTEGAASYANNPNFNLNGWSADVFLNRENFDEHLYDIYDEYGAKMKTNPFMALGGELASSAAMFSMSKRFLNNPAMKNLFGGNTDALNNIMKSAMNAQSTPQNNNSQSNNSQGSNPLAGIASMLKGQDTSKLMSGVMNMLNGMNQRPTSFQNRQQSIPTTNRPHQQNFEPQTQETFVSQKPPQQNATPISTFNRPRHDRQGLGTRQPQRPVPVFDEMEPPTEIKTNDDLMSALRKEEDQEMKLQRQTTIKNTPKERTFTRRRKPRKPVEIIKQ